MCDIHTLTDFCFSMYVYTLFFPMREPLKISVQSVQPLKFNVFMRAFMRAISVHNIQCVRANSLHWQNFGVRSSACIANSEKAARAIPCFSVRDMIRKQNTVLFGIFFQITRK